MHARPLTKSRPAQAVYVDQVLDVIIQVIAVITQLEGLFGFDLSELFGKAE